MPINAYINFNGNCRQAVEFYSKVFHTETPKLLTFGDSHSSRYPLPEDAKNSIMYTHLMICGSKVMFSDILPGMEYLEGNHISLAVSSSNLEQIKEYFEALQQGGIVEMDLTDTGWSKCFGIIKDKFGITWQLNCE